MGGKSSAEYYRAWRAAHPDYRARERHRTAVRRKTVGREDRRAEYDNRNRKRRVVHGDDGWLLESSIVRKARSLASTILTPDRRTVLWDDRHEDLIGVCIVALCEDEDAEAAMRAWLKAERNHCFHRAPLLDD